MRVGHGQCPREVRGRGSLRALVLERACVRLLLWLACVLFASAGALAQSAGGAVDATETLACDGSTISRAMCKPARVCSDVSNIPLIQADAGSGLPAARSNTITFSGIPPSGATVTYAIRVPRLNTSALTPNNLVQDAQATTTLTTSGDSIGPLGIGQSSSVDKVASAGYVERLDIADRGSTLRVVSYSVRCVPTPTKGTLTLIKTALGGNGAFDVTVTGPSSSVQRLTTSGSPEGSARTTIDVDAGRYTISETPPAGWTLGGIACVKNKGTGTASGSTLDIKAGDAFTCTLTNVKQSAELTIRKTPRAAAYSRTGESALFDIAVENTTGVPLTNVRVSDATAVLNGCSAPSLAPGAVLNCTAVHRVTDGDLAARSYENVAIVEAVAPGSGTVTATAVARMTARIEGGLVLSALATPDTYSDTGETIDFAFTARNTGNVPLRAFALTSETTTIAGCAPIALGGTLSPGATTVCRAQRITQSSDMTAACVNGEARAQASRPAGDVAQSTASARACLTNTKTRGMLSRFIGRRTDLLAANEPDRARLMRRTAGTDTGTGIGDSNGSDPVGVTGEGEGGNMRMNVSSSLERLRQSPKPAKDLGDIGMEAPGGSSAKAPPSALDVWMEAHYQRWDSENDALAERSGDFAVAYLGADYLVAPGLLVGALVQVDWMSDFTGADGGEVTGVGWMAGPYLSMKISDNIFFDARGAWGTSSNDISPFGPYSDSFSTQRWLAKANLTGNWWFDGLRVSPSVGVIYASETQEGYTDTPGLVIPEQTAHVGRLTFGPEFGTAVSLGEGSVLEPHIAFTGLWDFAQSGQLDGNGLATTGDDLRLKIEGGATLRGASGTSIRATLSYDGIGAQDFSAWGGQLWVNIPLEDLGDEKLFASLLPACCEARSYLGGEPGMQVAQAADAPADAGAQSIVPGGAAPAADEGAEPSFDLPGVIVEQTAAPRAAAGRKKKRPAPANIEAKAKPSQQKTTGSENSTPSAGSPGDGEAPAGDGGGTGVTAGGEGDLRGRAGQRIVETVSSVDIITAKDIERSGARTLDEAIDLAPGVFVRNAADGVPRIDIRGFRTRSIQLLLDGVPLNSSFDGQFDPRAIPVENIARIKITKGASSVLYGPGGNAAVIDIVTKSAAKGLHGSVQAEWSPERGTQERLTASYGSKTLQSFFSASGLDQDAFELSDGFQPTGLQPDDERVNSDRKDRALYGNATWSPSEVAKFGLSVNYKTGEYGKPPATLTRLESDFVPRTRFERVEDYENLSLQSSAWIRFNSQFSVRPMAYFNRLDELTNAFDDSTFSTQVRGNSVSEDATTSIGGGGLQALFGGPGSQLTIALDGRNESWSSSGFEVACQVNANGICLLDGARADFDEHHDVQVFSAAAEQELKLAPRVSGVLGAGYAEQRREGVIDDDYTYLAGVRVDVTDTTAVRGSLARKIRFPTLRDLFARDGGNPDLQTEVSQNYEIGLEQALPEIRGAFSVALFHIDAENFIERENGIFSNISALRFRGVETTAVYRGIDNLELSGSYSYLDASNETPDAQTSRLQNRPAHKLTASLNYKFDGGLSVNADYLYIAGSYALSGGGDGGSGVVAALELDSYQVVNVGLKQDVLGTAAQLFGRVENLFDENYAETFGFPQPGRTFYAGMRAKW